MARARMRLSALLLACFAACSASVGAAGRQPTPGLPLAGAADSRVYTPIDDDVPNPERGFYRQFVPFWLGTQRGAFDDRILAAVRADGLTVVRAYFVIDEFAATTLPPQALDDIAAAFATVRRAGLKIIPRFAYNFPTLAQYPRAEDAPLERVLGHLDQLTPLLVANADVIAFMEAGFVGAWGEWHSSSNGLLDPDRGLNSRTAAIVNRLLSALPSTRMVALRYPFHKQQLFGLQPVAPRDAFSGTAQARLGAHNDCLGAGPTNAGTYSPPARFAQSIEALKTYLGLDNRFVPQGGETCGAGEDSAAPLPAEVRCSAALADLARMRWSTLNLGYHPDVIRLWQQEGCFGEIRRRLGYRFRLVDASLMSRAVAGRRWAVAIRVTNDGFAAPFNPRLVELVLRHAGSGRLVRFPVTADPRLWGPGETRVIGVDMVFPEGLDEGDYDVLLHLPDPERGLYGIPAYSIRFANTGVWEPSTGFNDLQMRTTVLAPATERRADCAEPDRGFRSSRCPGR